MDYPECYRLTFSGVIVAFMELAFAYCLLCVSAFVSIASKLCVHLPCPCSGIVGYKNSDLCVHKLLFDWPLTIILRIQKVSTSRTRIWHQEEEEEEKKMVDKKLDLIDKVRLLEEAEEERAARAALIEELEKERAASASATDEAMTMIQRLQAEKAKLEMEVEQYARLTEVRFAYDEGEMNILKEILLKRDKEKHFLEKQIQTYKQVDDPETVVHDVHVIEDHNVAKYYDQERKEDIVKDHDSASSSPHIS